MFRRQRNHGQPASAGRGVMREGSRQAGRATSAQGFPAGFESRLSGPGASLGDSFEVALYQR